MRTSKFAKLLVTLLSLTLASCSGTREGMNEYDDRSSDYAGRKENGQAFDAYEEYTPYKEGIIDRVFFAFDNSSINKEAHRALREYVDNFKRENYSCSPVIVLDGHTDDVGTAEYNLALGFRRANSVKKALQNLGMTSTIEVHSYGKFRPAEIGECSRARAMNRRVEIHLRD